MSHQQRRYSVTPVEHLHKRVGAQLRLGLDLVQPENGCIFEFLIDLRPIGQGDWSPELKMFDDSWVAFKEWSDVFAWFFQNADKRPQMAQAIEAMKGLGFVDYHQPRPATLTVTSEMLLRWADHEMPCDGRSLDEGGCCCAICQATEERSKEIVRDRA